MRFLLYNIRYGTGGHGPLFPWSGYFRRTQANLSDLIGFMKPLCPDIVGLIEVDAGSYRAGRQNQAQTIADELGHYNLYRSKYANLSLANLIPILNKQGNAFLARDTVKHGRVHYFEKGSKRLVLELELEDVTLFLVHLALGFRVRHHQLGDLYSIIKHTTKPMIVAGDFNTAWGDQEIRLFLAASGLVNAGPENVATFPSWAPKRNLDFILHSPEIRVTGFQVPRVTYSDHLPLVCDFEINRP